MPRQPNIVIVMSDQHNAHVMGCSGDPHVATPNLDSLASEGVQFTSTYCPYPLCAPSRMGFMTGQYPSTVGVWDNDSVLSSDVPTFAHSLGAGGYETVLCGRMHFGGPDQFHGFERRIHGDCGGFLSPDVLGEGRHHTNGQTNHAVQVAGHGRTGYQLFDRRVTRAAVQFIRERQHCSRPYCLVVGYILPHNPLICSRRLFEFYHRRLSVSEAGSECHLSHPAIRLWRQRRGVDHIVPSQAHRARAAYYGLVTELDANLGRLFRELRNTGQWERSVVAYCSDHGDMAGEHGLWWKSCFFEGSARVPLTIRGPSVVRTGRQVSSVVSLVDLAPTVVELAGAPALPDIEGRSLVPFLADSNPVSQRDEAYCEYIGAHGDQPCAMIRSGPWKLMVYPEVEDGLLFNLDEDPGEAIDRRRDPAVADTAAALEAKLRARWSPERMLAGHAREMRARQMIRSAGHPQLPHPVVHDRAPEGANSFDFAQLPAPPTKLGAD